MAALKNAAHAGWDDKAMGIPASRASLVFRLRVKRDLCLYCPECGATTLCGLGKLVEGVVVDTVCLGA
jgi:hypothetical protein